MVALTSLSPRSPRPSPSPAKPRRRLPPPHVTATPYGRMRPTAAVASATTSSDGGTADDYHSTIRSLNSRGRHVPRKSLGQNYMLNARVNEELVAAAGVEEGDVVLEIGPGTGSLTAALLAAGATVVAVEKDKSMAALVRDRFGSTNQLKIIEEDITKFHVHSHFLPILEKKSHHKYAKVVANLPFNVSTEVVKQILPMGDVFSVMVLMLQDETALRLANAAIQTPEYRPINVFVNFYSEPEYKFKVERANFFPQPKVDGGVIRFKLKNAGEYPHVSSNKSFFAMVNSAFNGKRKMLRKSLQHICSSADIEAALTNIGLQATARPSDLVMDDFVRLHNHLPKTRCIKHVARVICSPARAHCSLQELDSILQQSHGLRLHSASKYVLEHQSAVPCMNNHGDCAPISKAITNSHAMILFAWEPQAFPYRR